MLRSVFHGSYPSSFNKDINYKNNDDKDDDDGCSGGGGGTTTIATTATTDGDDDDDTVVITKGKLQNFAIYLRCSKEF